MIPAWRLVSWRSPAASLGMFAAAWIYRILWFGLNYLRHWLFSYYFNLRDWGRGANLEKLDTLSREQAAVPAPGSSPGEETSLQRSPPQTTLCRARVGVPSMKAGSQMLITYQKYQGLDRHTCSSWLGLFFPLLVLQLTCRKEGGSWITVAFLSCSRMCGAVSVMGHRDDYI